MCEDGEIEADDLNKRITVRKFPPNGCESYDERTIQIRANRSGHGGGDAGIMEDFAASIGSADESRSSISRSVESHIMACALEESRLTDKVVELDKFRKSIMEA